MSCDDLRLGGTLTASGISGGTSINSTLLSVTSWDGIFGVPGFTGTPLEVNGRPGQTVGGDLLGKGRFLPLPITMTRQGPLTECENLWENTDDFLTLATSEDWTYLEVDLPDGTSRFLKVRNLDPASMTARKRRSISIPLLSDWPWWRAGGLQSTDTIAAADTLVVAGRKSIYDAVLVFAGDGTFTHSTLGWSIQVTGSAGPVTVNLGDRTVIEGGNPALNRIRRNNRDWGWFTPGNNSVTANVSVVVTWRSQYA